MVSGRIAALLALAAAVSGLLTAGRLAARAPVSNGSQAEGASGGFYRAWTMDDLLPAIADLGEDRSYEQGSGVFEQAACGLCHAFGGVSTGNGLAPDLTGVRAAFSRGFLLESILEPSATINGRFYHTRLRLKDGRVIDGSVLDIVDGTFIVAQVMMAPEVTVEVPEADVTSELPSPVSPMPAGLVDRFTRDQILDLVAFLESGGDPDASVFTSNK